jgi:hypothetical protein
MDYAAGDPPIVHPVDAPHIRRQMRFDPLPLLVAQPKQILPHDPDPPSKSGLNRIRIALRPQQN